jgi:hypothetical protein
VAAAAVGFSTNSNERPTHFLLTLLSALSCTLLIGATANRTLRGSLCCVPWLMPTASGAPVLLAAPSAAHVLSAFVRRAVPRPPCLPAARPGPSSFRPVAAFVQRADPRPPCLPAARPGPSSFRPVAAFVQRAEPRPPCLRLSSRRHTEMSHEGTFFSMNTLNSF